jgi:hypothetical protein
MKGFWDMVQLPEALALAPANQEGTRIGDALKGRLPGLTLPLRQDRARDHRPDYLNHPYRAVAVWGRILSFFFRSMPTIQQTAPTAAT